MGRLFGPLAAKLAGRVDEGFICTSARSQSSGRSSQRWRNAPRRRAVIEGMIDINVTTAATPTTQEACHLWAPLALPPGRGWPSSTRSTRRRPPTRSFIARTRFTGLRRSGRVVEGIDQYVGPWICAPRPPGALPLPGVLPWGASPAAAGRTGVGRRETGFAASERSARRSGSRTSAEQLDTDLVAGGYVA
jgi:hypothetical protein